MSRVCMGSCNSIIKGVLRWWQLRNEVDISLHTAAWFRDRWDVNISKRQYSLKMLSPGFSRN